MAKRIEMDLDAALAALAREAQDASPRPGPDLSALVMADAALSVLAHEAAQAAPRPGRELVARVLSDAAEVAATNAAADAVPAAPWRRRAGGGLVQGGLVGLLFGWRAGAVACMLLGLAVGMGLGLEIEPGALPVLDDPLEERDALAFAGLDSGFDIVEGL